MKNSKHKKHLKPNKLIKNEIEISGKKDYLTAYISRINQTPENEIKKFDWSNTKSSSLAANITYKSYRYIIDNIKIDLPTRYIAERQLNELQHKINYQHLFHRPDLLGIKISNQFQNNLTNFATPEEAKENIFKNVNQGDEMNKPNAWSNKRNNNNFIPRYKNYNKFQCKFCIQNKCRNPNHKNSNNFNSNYYPQKNNTKNTYFC